MPKNQKSPHEKKALEYEKDHFTGGWHSSRFFPKTWRRKKKHANRQYRHKSEALLAQNKTGATGVDVELLADDLTAACFQRSVSRKRLHKIGTVTLQEKVKRKLEKRTRRENRKNDRRNGYDQHAASAIRFLTSLEENELEVAVLQANLVCSKHGKGLKIPAMTPLDQALDFLYLVSHGSSFQLDALRRNPSLDQQFANWLVKANRILLRSRKKQETKTREKKQTSEKMRSQMNQKSIVP